MTVQTQDSEKVTVVLTDSTQVREPEGAFRKKPPGHDRSGSGALS